MAISRSSVLRFVLSCVPPILGSMLVGFIFHGEEIFDRHFGSFQFVWSGVAASVFYYLLVTVRTRDSLAGLVVLFMLTLLTTQSSRPAYVLRDTFYVSALAASIYIYFRYFRNASVPTVAYTPVVLAGIYGLTYVLTSEIHLWIIRGLAMDDTGGNMVSLASTSAYFGLLVGVGVGSGIAATERGISETKL